MARQQLAHATPPHGPSRSRKHWAALAESSSEILAPMKDRVVLRTLGDGGTSVSVKGRRLLAEAGLFKERSSNASAQKGGEIDPSCDTSLIGESRSSSVNSGGSSDIFSGDAARLLTDALSSLSSRINAIDFWKTVSAVWRYHPKFE